MIWGLEKIRKHEQNITSNTFMVGSNVLVADVMEVGIMIIVTVMVTVLSVVVVMEQVKKNTHQRRKARWKN